jgi:hypothetical protein
MQEQKLQLSQRDEGRSGPATARLITAAEIRELRKRWEHVGVNVSLHKVLGQVSGVSVNGVQKVTEILKTMGVEEDERLTDLMTRYGLEVASGGWVALPEMRKDAGAFAEWVGGLGNAVIVDRRRLNLLPLFDGDGFEHIAVRNSFVIPGAFADRAYYKRSILSLTPGIEKQNEFNRKRLLDRWEEDMAADREALARDLLLGQRLAVELMDSLEVATLPSPTVRREGRKIGANEACPCGSGKKYKKCHGLPGAGPLPAES